MGTRILGGLAVTSVLVFAAACGGSGGGGTPAPQDSSGGTVPTSAPATPAGAAAAASCTAGATDGAKQINIVNTHDVDQPNMTVTSGTSITWNNNSKTNHQIYFDGGPDCGILVIGKSVSIKFDNPGTFHWVDHIYPTYVSGTITVQ